MRRQRGTGVEQGPEAVVDLYLDLHGKTQHEAMLCLASALNAAENRRCWCTLVVDAGRGKHSGAMGGPVLRPMTREYLETRQYPFTEDKGRFSVTISPYRFQGRPGPAATGADRRSTARLVSQQEHHVLRAAARKRNGGNLAFSSYASASGGSTLPTTLPGGGLARAGSEEFPSLHKAAAARTGNTRRAELGGRGRRHRQQPKKGQPAGAGEDFPSLSNAHTAALGGRAAGGLHLPLCGTSRHEDDLPDVNALLLQRELSEEGRAVFLDAMCPIASPEVVPPEQIAVLVDMGFSEEAAQSALEESLAMSRDPPQQGGGVSSGRWDDPAAHIGHAAELLLMSSP
uniref:Smr domain-containing protein n=1 Tax=Rhizochromulina marina TaxID=1034831 RepID=A0A7S2SUU6_9STRA